jgi:predicted DNA-binding transcriptional regulator AlpA
MVVPAPVRSEALYITAKEAAAALGVSIPTLYAYVSRGLIRSQGVAGSRNRRYWKVDIERLRGRRVLHEHSQGQASPRRGNQGFSRGNEDHAADRARPVLPREGRC